MDASIVAVGLIILHAFATLVVWLELRSYEKESKERVDRATKLVLEAINGLRRDLAPVPGGGGGAPLSGSPVGGDAPVGEVISSERDILRPPAPSMAPPPPSSDEVVALIRARYEAEADERDARSGACDVAEDARRTVEVPRVEVDADQRPTDEELTVVRDRKPPHKPPVPIKSDRATLLGVVDAAPPRATPTLPCPAPAPRDDGHCGGADCFQSDHEPRGENEIDACSCPCAACIEAAEALLREEEERGTPSVPPPRERPRFDGRVSMRYRELVAAAQADGKNARHCLSAKCCGNEGGIAECACECRNGCGLLADLWARAVRETSASRFV